MSTKHYETKLIGYSPAERALTLKAKRASTFHVWHLSKADIERLQYLSTRALEEGVFE